MRASVLLLAATLGACSAIDRQQTVFEPMAGGDFRYVAFADNVYPLDSVGAERDRREWLERYLRDNGLCPSGYEITERKPVVQTTSAIGLGNTYRVFYRGRCKS